MNQTAHKPQSIICINLVGFYLNIINK